SISGNVGVADFVLREKTDTPLLNLPTLDVVIEDVEVFAKQATLKSVKVQGPELHVTHNRDGTLNFNSLIAESKTEKAQEQKTDEKPFGYRIDEIAVDQGKVFFTDRSPERPFEKRLENIHAGVKGLTNEADKKAP